MPYKSEKQRAWMHINRPEIAKKWDKEYGGKIDSSKSMTRKPATPTPTKNTVKRKSKV